MATLPESQRNLFLQAYEQARADGLCHDRALELALEVIRQQEPGKISTHHNIQTKPTP